MRIRRAATRLRGLAELSAMTASSCSAVVWYLPVVDDPIRRKATAYTLRIYVSMSNISSAPAQRRDERQDRGTEHA